jgi:hypothetical protein
MSDASPPEIPDSVFDDLADNRVLIRRWVKDTDFRVGLLTADDPAQYALEQGFSLRAETSAWIKERVAARGVDAFLDPTRPIAL